MRLGGIGDPRWDPSLGSRRQGQRATLRIASDNMAALTLVLRLSSPVPRLNALGAELAWTLEEHDVTEVLAVHLPGRLNEEADYLSRLSAPSAPVRLPTLRLLRSRLCQAHTTK